MLLRKDVVPDEELGGRGKKGGGTRLRDEKIEQQSEKKIQYDMTQETTI